MLIKDKIIAWLDGVPKRKILYLQAERDYTRYLVEEYKKDLLAAQGVISQL